MKIFNILYVNNSAVLFGAERRLIDIIEHLDKTKFKSFVLLPESGLLEQELVKRGVRVIIYDFRSKRNKNSFLESIALAAKLSNVVKEHKIDLVHLNLLYPFTMRFWLGFILLKVPLIAHVRDHTCIKTFDKIILLKYAKIIFISESVKSFFLVRRRFNILTKIIKNRIEVIYNGLDMETFRNYRTDKTLRQEYGIGQNELIIALAGAIHPFKGQDIFVKAILLIIRKYQNLKFFIIGSSYFDTPEEHVYQSYIKQLIIENDLKGSIIMCGYRDDMPHVMNSIDILVQPSSIEGLGMSIIEAMACGKPVIGTAVGGIPEVICDGAGILIPDRKPESLANAISFFLNNPEKAKEAGLRGRNRVIDKFNICKTIKKLETIYLEEIQKNIS